jgi:DNA polymerase-3 subunit beta
VLGTDQLKIICTNSEQEEAEEELEIDYKGEALDIGFNITYLLDVLHNPQPNGPVCLWRRQFSALIRCPIEVITSMS